MPTDTEYMTRALAFAERGRGRTSPNPAVGALVVDADGVVVGRGAHEFAGGPHAEIRALADAGERATGSTLYCTLEPCCHMGRTGPCAPRVVAAGIRRAVIAMEDPNPLVAGRGIAYLRDHGVDVSVGVLRDEAARLNRPFVSVMRRGLPFVTMKVALSLDGGVARSSGTRSRLTGDAANRLIHRERAEVDAIAVGSGTILADDPLLTARGAYRTRPLVRLVFDRRLRTPPTARILSTHDAGPVIIVSTTAGARGATQAARALQAAGAILETVDTPEDAGSSFLKTALRRLPGVGVTSLIVEGGPTLHQAFWDADLVDRVELFVTPHVLGSGAPGWIAHPAASIIDLADVIVRPVGEDVMIEGYVHRPD